MSKPVALITIIKKLPIIGLLLVTVKADQTLKAPISDSWFVTVNMKKYKMIIE